MGNKYESVSVGVLFDTIESDDILSFLRRGIETKNVILSMTAFETLINRGYYNELIDMLVEALCRGAIDPSDTFGVTLSNYLVAETEPHHTELRKLGDIIGTAKNGFEAAEQYTEQKRRVPRTVRCSDR